MLRLVAKNIITVQELETVSAEWVFDLNEYLDIMEEAERKQNEKAYNQGRSGRRR